MNIRNANINDAKGLLDIRNNKIIRALSSDKKIILISDHVKWLKKNLANSKNINLVYVNNEEIIDGYCRLDYMSNGIYLISIAVSPNSLSKGIGTQLINRIISMLKIGDIINAEILDTNHKSIKFFSKYGFKKTNNNLYKFQKI